MSPASPSSINNGGRSFAASLLYLFSFSLIFAATIAASTYLALYLHYDLIKDYPLTLIGIYFFGAYLGATFSLIALAITRRILNRWSYLPRLLVIVALISGSVIFATAALFALEYRSFYAQWHAPTFSKIWFFEQAFTSLGAFYQFAVLGLRFYLPAAPFIVFLASIILSRRIS